MQTYKDITQHEIEALKHEFNMSDAHTHQSQSPTQKKIIKNLKKYWYESENMTYDELRLQFVQKFFEFRKQPSALKHDTCLLAYSASVSTAIVAHYFKQKNMSVTVLNPSFDNLVDLLKLADNKLKPLSEKEFHETPDIYEFLSKKVKTDALYLTDPNNPTGKSITTKGKQFWYEVIRFCVDHDVTLMVDFCFAPFLHANDDFEHYDIYEIFERSNVSYITLEDTGKSWPIQDMKAAILKCSSDVYSDLSDISSIYLLQVSPFALRVLIEYLKDAINTEFKYTATLMKKNWRVVEKKLEGTFLSIVEPDTLVPVVWCEMDESISGDHLKQYLEIEYNVHVVPGKYFYWRNQNQHKHFIRIALARDTNTLTDSMTALRKGLLSYEKKYILNK